MYGSCFQDDEATAGFALDGLKQVMAVKSRSVLPYLVPKVRDGLLRSPALNYVTVVDRTEKMQSHNIYLYLSIYI